ncbi:lipopolysaccharide heptosyltransferase I [uncultured Campylobacter sp.]|uniref:lipopolysaccharide heptosyltransferase I n=1 Tax=uncultured Campylobacter sp. TaxID=218934 RepID=UPI00260E7639|nr:lipopolysaccharide heptosyltransferase I [uncultured Campylobacter sp.]
MSKNLSPNIAVIKLSALGDIVHAVVILQFIEKHLPKAKITWFADAKFSEILFLCPQISRVVSLPLKNGEYKKSLELIASAKKEGKFDYVIDLQGLIKSAAVAKLLGKNSYGFDKFSVKEPIAALFYRHKFNCDYAKNIILRNLSLTAFALGFSFSEDEILAKQPCFSASQSKFKSLKKKILIAPFASEPSKIYDKFGDVIALLDEPKNEIFVCYNGEKEEKEALNLIKNSNVKTLNLSLKELVSFISSCDLVIGNDSGVTHIAWAQNRPSITLFGNRPAERNAYATPVNLTIDAGKKIDAKKIDKSDFCVRDIAPQAIANAAKRLLDA